MARNTVRMTYRILRHAASAAAVVVAMLLAPSTGAAQQEPVRPTIVRAREALRLGMEYFKRGDNETASLYFTHAHMGLASLSSSEQQDLSNFGALNEQVLKERQNGNTQLNQAEELFKQGKVHEASHLLNALDLNPHLSMQDRQRLGHLQAQSAKGEPPGKRDAKSLLVAGRSALNKGDLPMAENYLTQAEKTGSTIAGWLQPWSDSPSKLRRDIDGARTKQQALLAGKTETEAKEGWMPSFKNWFARSEKCEKLADNSAPVCPEATKTSTSKFLSVWPFGQFTSGAKVRAQSPSPVPDPNQPTLPAFNPPPLDNNLPPLGGFPAAGSNPQAKLPDPQQVLPDPQQVLPDARQMLPNPNDIPPPPGTNPGSPSAPNVDARGLLREGRALLQQKRYDEADKLCTQALNSGMRWGLFELDTPEKLRRDIMRLRQTSDRDQSAKLMLDARKLFTQGNLEQAESRAYEAQRLHGPYGVFDFGDRPERLLEDIHKARLAKGKDANPPASKDRPNLPPGGLKDLPNSNNQQAKGPNPGYAPAVPAGLVDGNKRRALVLLHEARELERQGKIPEARLKTLEARSLPATFLPEEESPDLVLLRLSGKCDEQVQTLLQQTMVMAGNASDPQRFEKAQSLLLTAHKLATDFGLDTTRVEQQRLWMQQVMAGGNPPSPNYINPNVETGSLTPEQQMAREKLRFAHNELMAGKYKDARRIAEELFHPQFAMQEDAMRLIRTIDAEEYNLRILDSKRTFDSGMDAFTRKDYKSALEIFQSINLQLLPEQYQTRLRDIMSTREMQPESIRLTQYSGGEKWIKGGPINAVPPGEGSKEANEEDLLKKTKDLDTIQFQALRMRGREAQKVAMDLFKNGQDQQAIASLLAYIQQVEEAQLQPDKSNELRRESEQRIQQFRTQLAQKELTKRTNGERYPTKWDENAYQGKIQDHQKEVSKMMREARELYQENKLKESEVIIKKVRQIDPDNTAAFALDFQIQVKRNQQKHDGDVHANEKIFLKALSGDLGAYADMDNPVVFDAERLKRRQKGGNGEIWLEHRTPKERAIESRLDQPISLSFKNVPLESALRSLALQSGVQVVPDSLAFQDAGIRTDAPLTLTVENISMKSALNLLLRPLRLAYVIENEVLNITTVENTSARLRRVTYPVADLVILPKDNPMPSVLNITDALERTMQPNIPFMNGQMSPYTSNNGVPVSSFSQSAGLGSAFASNNNGGGGGGGGNYQRNNLSGQQQSYERSPDAVAEKLKELIQNTVRKNSWESMGGQGNVQYFPMGMALVVNQIQEVQEEILALLQSLRKLQDLQVAVEMRAVLVSETFFERIGVDFNMNIRTPTSSKEPNLVAGNFTPFGFVNRTGAGLNGLVSGLTPAGTLTPDLNIPVRNSTFQFTTPQFGGYQPEAGLSLGLAFLSDIQVFMFLEAVQGDRRAHIMQAPRITVYNGQNATIGASVVRPQVSSLIPIQLPSGNVIMSPNLNQIPFGMIMQVQPVVSPDRRFIRLNLSPQMTSPVLDPAAATVVPVPLGFVGTFDGGAQIPAFANSQVSVTVTPQPVNLIIANTTVNVPDGGTVLLGGFKFLAEERSEYGPPILSKIPYLSRLFRNVGWSRDGSTLMYLVTARIIMVEEEEQIFLGNLAPLR